ncbi:MAG: phospho-N-acetylmuramoyl-pentapeptide-transferase [Actinomycetota bacterium]|nr:phospho-N-acetylmuramoyl-pentapeptide-transferase [Actinomycetota bacterium]MEA2842805.1 phospho-N-acetylmuramoyl-pentapeptide-transferase [Actinomycetota bacterium]
MVALLIAGGVALITAILGTPILIRSLAVRGIGQQIREDGPQGHLTKAGTPTMGGVAILGAVVVGYVAAHIRTGAVFTASGVLVILVMLGAGLVGLADDWIKISRQRSLGLTKMAKTLSLVAVFLAFAIFAVWRAGVRADVSFARDVAFDLPDPIYLVWAVLLLLAAANAVNLSDGLDGLAAGSSMYAFSAFVFVGFWQFRHASCYGLGPALDLSVIAAAMTGACAGFLWWNAAPAKIFMGDTGSLGIGAGLGALALTTNTQLLLPVIGGLFVMITMSVVVQVIGFRLWGIRVFRMAPIHHHFELLGWPEPTVIVRFWILAALLAALAMGLFYADFLSAGICRVLDQGA